MPLPLIDLSAGDLADLYLQAASALRGATTTIAPRVPVDLPDLIEALFNAASELEAVVHCERRFREP